MISKDKGTKYFCTSDVFHKDLMSRQEKHVLARYNDTFRCSHNPMAMAYAASDRPLANTAGIDFFSQRSKSRSIYTKSPLSSGKKGRKLTYIHLRNFSIMIRENSSKADTTIRTTRKHCIPRMTPQ